MRHGVRVGRTRGVAHRGPSRFAALVNPAMLAGIRATRHAHVLDGLGDGSMRQALKLLKCYGIALLASLAAFAIAMAVDAPFARLSPFFLFYAAVAVSSWCGGTGPGLLATLLGAMAGAYFLLEPRYSMKVQDPGDLARLVLFVLVGVLIASLNGALLAARQRWKAEAARARRSESRARRLAEANLIGVFFSDVEGNITEGNDEFLRLVGATRAELPQGRLNWQHVTAPEHHPRNRHALDELKRCGVCTPFEKDHILRDEERVPVLMACAMVDESQNDVVGFVLDLTERRRAEAAALAHQERLQAMASELMLAEERERRRIATVLHDSVGHTLAFAKHKLRGLLESAESEGDRGDRLVEIYDLVDQAVTHTRSLTSEISPPVLYELGLGPALQWLTDQVQERHGVVCEFDDDDRPKPMSHETRIVLFQAVRELLVNVVKHAKAGSCRVQLQREGRAAKVTVADDGTGFDVAAVGQTAARNNAFGLFNIRERLTHVGGKVEIMSAAGAGTTAELTAPLETAPEREAP